MLGVECCWLKLTLMQAALNAGYTYVIFLDADAYVQPRCPDIKTIETAGKYLYMAKGYSKRFNSGVMIAKNNEKVTQWLTQVINSRNDEVLPENDVGWGENGHVIQHGQGCHFIHEIPQKWNNTHDANLADYIRHQNCGPLRDSRMDNLFHKILFSATHRTIKLCKYIKRFTTRKDIETNLQVETEKVLSIYPCFELTPNKNV